MTDPVLDALLAEAADDPGTLGLLLTGSRSAGLEDESSDYDILFLLSDDAYDERKPAEAVLRFHGHPPAEIFWAPDELEDAFLAIVRTADPAEQRRLQARVERLMESRGDLAHREWGHALAHAKQG